MSVIIPCRNEDNYIGSVLQNMQDQDYPKNRFEIFVVDGQSTDKTVEIIERWVADSSRIYFLKNEEKIVSHALNKGIRKSKGEVIMRIDAHSVYPSNYISKLVEKLFELKADNIGGSWLILPSNNSLEAHLIAESTSNLFGIGNSYYRLNINKVKKVDTVPFGCYKREVFDRIGFFDTELVRNQDDEFNARLINAGGTIYLVPQVRITYYAREKLGRMISMFYQYGLYKPLVNLKLGKPATLRQFFPLVFTLFMLSLFMLPFIHEIVFSFALYILVIYFILGMLFSVKTVWEKKNIVYLFLLPLMFFIIHLSYGTGYLAGIIKFLLLRKKIKAVGINR